MIPSSLTARELVAGALIILGAIAMLWGFWPHLRHPLWFAAGKVWDLARWACRTPPRQPYGVLEKRARAAEQEAAERIAAAQRTSLSGKEQAILAELDFDVPQQRDGSGR